MNPSKPEVNEKLLKPYNPQETESRIYKKWEESGFFNPDVCIKKGITKADAEAFSIVLPPPNVTGTLHIGHAAMLAIEDIAVRFNRMRGKRTLWIPGTDHAAIATQTKVEKLVEKEEGKRRHDLGREEFLKRVEKFAQESHDTIITQVKAMGASLDWSREAYTLDQKREIAVRTAFKTMYDSGLIYQGHRIVNWDPKGQTTISDDEIVYETRKTVLYTFKYGKDFPISISTTRPETKIGDTAVAVHPEDERYKKYVGNEYDTDFAGTPIHIKIVADTAVDKEFGTGAVGVTPAHSFTDWEIAQRHSLPMKHVIDEHGKMIAENSILAGKKVTEAREIVANWLRDQGLMEKEENIEHNVATAERTGGTVEPLPKLQWFINVNKKFTIPHSKISGIASGSETTLKELMLASVNTRQIEIIPERFGKVYTHWIENLRDWCISRQIWFGHRIPVWYKTEVGTEKEAVHFNKIVLFKKLNVKDEPEFNSFSTDILLNQKEDIIWFSCHPDKIQLHQHYVNILNERGLTDENWIGLNRLNKPIRKSEIYCGVEAPKEIGWMQDEDTLDTWFSSGLWTFSTLGWPEKSLDLKNFHPTSLLETGYDIIFFWVARMILMTTCLVGDIPFKKVYLHGLVRDAKGRKMSKSLGNIVDPRDLIGKYGADATRLSLIIGTGPGNDMKLDEQKVKGYKNFANKLWNITRFVLENTKGVSYDENFSDFSEDDQKLWNEFSAIIADVTGDIEAYRFHLAGEKLYHYAWHEFADKIIEASKKIDTQSRKQLLLKILRTTVIALHPFMPFVTEEIWDMLGNEKMLIVEAWPTKIK